MDSQKAIGIENKMPWHLPEDLRHFRKLTLGHAVVMGRATYESIGRPLPQRRNVVLTRNREFEAPGCTVVHSLQEAIVASEKESKIFIIGGADVYSQALPLADLMYLTEITCETSALQLFKPFECDTYFPTFNSNEWRQVRRGQRQLAKGTANAKFYYRFSEYKRRKKKIETHVHVSRSSSSFSVV